MGSTKTPSTCSTSKPNLSPHVVHGYEAPFLWSIVSVLLVSALHLNEYVLHHLGIPHALIFMAIGALVAVHEVLRPFVACVGDFPVLLCGITSSASQALAQHARRGFRPQFNGWTCCFHVLQAVLRAVSTHHGHTIIWLHNAKSFRRNADLFGRAQGWLSCWMHGVTLESFTHNGLEHLWLRPNADMKTETSEPKRQQPSIVILYFHGGGYSGMSPRVYTDFCNRLSRHIRDQLKLKSQMVVPDIEVLVANYRKLPEVVFPIPVDDCVVMYEYLTSQMQIPPSNVVLAGDSAGAGLVLSTLLRLRDANNGNEQSQQLPLAAICSCPFVDFSRTEPPSHHCIMHAPVPDVIRDFCVFGDQDNCDAWREAHIVDRDLSNLSPLFIQTGAFDVFHQHALKLAAKAQKSNEDCVTEKCSWGELDTHPEMPHVFSTFPKWLLPGSEQGIANMAAFIVKRLQTVREGANVAALTTTTTAAAADGDPRARSY